MADSTVLAMQPSMVVQCADVFSAYAAHGCGGTKCSSSNHVHASLNPYRACEGQWASDLQNLAACRPAPEQLRCQDNRASPLGQCTARTTNDAQEPFIGVNSSQQLNMFANGFVSALLTDTVSNFVDDVIYVIDDFENDEDVELDAAQAARASVEDGNYRVAQLYDDVAKMQQPRTIMKVATSSTLTGGEFENGDDYDGDVVDDVFSVTSDEEEQIGTDLINWAVGTGFKEEVIETNQICEFDFADVEFTFSAWAAELEEQVMKDAEASLVKTMQAAWVSNYIGSLLDEGIGAITKEQVNAERQQVEVRSHQEEQFDSAAAKLVTTAGVTAPRSCTTKSSKTELRRRKSDSTMESSPPSIVATTTPSSRTRRRIIGGVGRTPVEPQRCPDASRPQDHRERNGALGTEINFVKAQDKWIGAKSRLDSDHKRALSLGGAGVSRAPSHSGLSALAMDLGEDAPGRSMWQEQNRASPQHHNATLWDMRRSSSLGTLKVSKSHNQFELSPLPRQKINLLPGLPNNVTSQGSIAWSVHMARSGTWRNNVAGVF